MNILLDMFKERLREKDLNAASYTKQKLKARLVSVFKETIVFQQAFGPAKPEIVYYRKSAEKST